MNASLRAAPFLPPASARLRGASDNNLGRRSFSEGGRKASENE
jgi:hypothetical protein